MTNKHSRLSGLLDSKYSPLLFFVVSFVFVTLFSRSTSFLYVFEGADPAIFKQMGLALLKGKTLYIDYFDNKGCILYFIQALGLWLGGDFFILLMQTVSLTITLVIWDKMFALYRDERGRLLGLGLALVLLLCFYQDGDLTEEWCLPFASYPLLLYFRSLKSGKQISPLSMFSIGLCFGVIVFIRVNNAAPFWGFIAYYWIQLLINRSYAKLFQSIAVFFSGLFVVASACLLYFYLKAGWDGVGAMMYATFLSNFEYILVKVERKLYVFVLYYLFLSLCITQQIMNSRHDKALLIPSLISYALFIVASGTRCFTHYLISLLPMLIVLLMTMPSEQEKARKPFFVASLLLVMCFYLPIPLALTVNDLILKNDKYTKIYDDFHHCIENIPENERDSICNYNLLGNGYGMMMHEGLLQSNRNCVSYVTVYMPSLWKQTTNYTMNPKWILVSWDRYFIKEDAYFISNNYDLYCEFDHNRMYLQKPKIGQTFRVYLYRRKQ